MSGIKRFFKELDERRFLQAVAKNDVAAAEAWIEKHRNHRGLPVLVTRGFQEAAGKGHMEMAVLLEGYGANVRAHDDNALRLAALHGHRDMVLHLVKRGADITCQYQEPLRNAVSNNHVETARLLVTLGANARLENDFLLFLAAAGGKKEMVQLFLDAGCDPNGYWGAQMKQAVRDLGHAEIAAMLEKPSTQKNAAAQGNPPARGKKPSAPRP